jgi:2,3-bisphosphoglycerate-independent phosphoglycerate mutase
MKHIFLVGDGMADEPIPELGGRTPLEAASVPNMDRLAREGVLGLCRTIPEGLPPGSDVANLSLLGYDPRGCYTGRGPLEAVSLGIELGKEDCAFRCNLVNVAEGRMVDYSSGHISAEEGGRIAEELDRRFSGEGVRFYRGVGYRHICVVKGDFRSLECTPPHDITGRPVEAYLPRGEGASKALALMQASVSVLSASPVNRERVAQGKTPATQIWLWGQGYRPELPGFARRFGVSGSVITAVDLIRGIGTLAGLEVVPVEGATGFIDTNYEGKADAALRSLEKKDFVFVHVEAPDEAGHIGKTDLKIRAIEDLDRRLLGRLLGRIGEGFRILLMPDHPTPIRIKTHSGGPVPFALWGSGIAPNGPNSPNGTGFSERGFSEREAKATGLFVEEGHEIINLLFQRR